MSKSILIFSYYTNMPGACQAEWIDDRMESYISKGYKISIISATCCFKHTHPNITHIRLPALSPTGASYEYEEILRRKIRHSNFILMFYLKFMDGVFKIMKKLEISSGEGRWSWFVSAIIGFAMLKKANYEYVYTTGGPASAHLAGIFVAKFNSKKVICELQDPLSGKDIGRNKFSQKGLRFFERIIIKYSNLVIYCTKNAMQYAKDQYPIHNDKIDYIYPGSKLIPDIEKNHNREYNDSINITYLGSLYQTRNLDNLMDALSNLALNNPEIINRLNINLYGNINLDIKKRIENFKYDVFQIHGLVDREIAINKALESDVLLLVQNTDDRSITTIPFKTYDYMHTGKLILGLIYRNEEIKEMLNSHGHLTCQADNISEIQEALNNILNNFEILNKKISKSNYTPINAVENMQLLMQSLL